LIEYFDDLMKNNCPRIKKKKTSLLMFVVAFNSADPGVLTVANSFYGGLPANIVGASLGGLNITTVDSMKAMLPVNPTLGIQECRQRCGL
jgi:hypothetical protein